MVDESGKLNKINGFAGDSIIVIIRIHLPDTHVRKKRFSILLRHCSIRII